MVAPALIDTNILVDHFNGIPEASTEIGFYDDLAISSITWMEVITGFYAAAKKGSLSEAELRDIEAVLAAFPVIHVDDRIMKEAAMVRAASIVATPKIALPDAIIRATGNITSRLIVTRNTNDFVGTGVRHPYKFTCTPPGTPGAGYVITNVLPPPV